MTDDRGITVDEYVFRKVTDEYGDPQWNLYRPSGEFVCFADHAWSPVRMATSDWLDEIEQLRGDLERTRQAWVDGEDPMCEDVCIVGCKGPCGVEATDE